MENTSPPESWEEAMDRRSLEQFKNILQTKLQQFQQSAGQARQQGRGLQTTESKHEGDLAVILPTKDMLFRQNAQNTVMLHAIGSALARIEDGSFGHCFNCEQEININRLKAIPWVRFCVPCQELTQERR